MKAFTSWSYTPFTRMHERRLSTLPHICRIAPFLGGFIFEWFDKGSDGAHKVIIKKRDSSDSPIVKELTERTVEIKGLEENITYEFTVYRADMSEHSATRLVRTGCARGTTINYVHPEDKSMEHSGISPCSPSILVLPSGKILAIMDIVNGLTDEKIAPIYESLDHGKTWQYVTELYPCHWPRLFYHRDRLYCFGQGNDTLMLGYSLDEGRTWSKPVSLVQGATRDWACHRGATPFVEYNGRIYTAIELGAWKFHCYYHMLLSAPADSDLMDAENWVLTEPAKVNLGDVEINSDVLTGAEGNAVVFPDGICNVLRVDPSFKNSESYYDNYNIAMVRRADPDDPEAPLVPHRVIKIPCGLHNKFEIRKEPSGLGYVMVGNEYTVDHRLRSILTLAVSKDGYEWKNAVRFLDARADEIPGGRTVAYSDPAIDFDGDDIVVITRTAANAPQNFHNNNTISFFKIKNYKQYFTN